MKPSNLSIYLSGSEGRTHRQRVAHDSGHGQLGLRGSPAQQRRGGQAGRRPLHAAGYCNLCKCKPWGLGKGRRRGGHSHRARTRSTSICTPWLCPPPLLGVLKLLVPKSRDHTSPQLKQGTMKKRLGVVGQLVGTGGYAALTAANRVEMAPFKLRCVETRRIVHRSRLTVIRRFVTSIEPARHCNTQIIMTRVVRGPRPPSH